MDIEIGDVIEAVVTRIENYGIFLESNGDDVLVLITEMSDQMPVNHPSDIATIGERLCVKILRYNDVDERYVATLLL